MGQHILIREIADELCHIKEISPFYAVLDLIILCGYMGDSPAHIAILRTIQSFMDLKDYDSVINAGIVGIGKCGPDIWTEDLLIIW